MTRVCKFLSVFALALFGIVGIFGQEKGETRQAVLLKAPKVEIPKEAAETGLGGQISVFVSVDELGNVVSADEVLGPDWVCSTVERPDVVSIRTVAKASAMSAKFTPALLDGKPVASKMRVAFKFPKRENASPIYTIKNSDDDQASSVLNGHASLLAEPTHPELAATSRITGQVVVSVVIDTAGKIFSAEPISGHPLLQAPAVLAACRSKFKPTILKGKPVVVTGRIVYNFLPKS